VPVSPVFGIRTFDELNATYAKLTGVSPNAASVATTYANVKQQLPTVESIDAFLASQQTGIAQLAIAYCNEMVKTPALRSAFYPGVDPNASSSDPTVRTALISAIKTKVIGNTVIQPKDTFVDTTLTNLFDQLSGASASTAMMAACAGALGSAATTMQ
jgi:hypothetical protein